MGLIGLGLRVLCISLLLFLSPITLAACPGKVQVIHQGEAANCDGFLFSDEAEQDASYYKALSDKLILKTNLQDKEINILEQRLTNYVNVSDTLSKEVSYSRNTENLFRFGYFVAGVLITGYIAANVH